jgi:ABC-type proline/glycine betaine transport systems, permease component
VEVWNYFRNNQSDVLHWLWNNAWLAGVPLVVGFLLALPLGYLASRYRWIYPPTVTAAGLLYTIPSLALFILLPGVLHTKILNPLNVAVALTIYTLALLVRVVADALNAVPEEARSTATAMGYTPRQLLLGIELPLAVPVISAGLRVAAVSNVSLVSVAAIIGVPQLGQLFTAGFQTFSNAPILLGLILVILLAFAFDAVILLIARALTPWQRVVQAR